MIKTEDLLKKRDRLKNILAVVAIGGVGLFVAPMILSMVAGIVGLLIAAGVSFTAVMLAPVAAKKLANLRYRLLDAEKVEHIKKVSEAAKENPIETLTSLILAKRQAFEQFRENVENAAAAREVFKKRLEGFAKKYPERATEFQAQYDRAAAMVEQKKAALKSAAKSLDQAELKLEEMKAYWEMSQDAQRLNAAAGMDTGDLYEKLKADTAVDAVFESVSSSFAQLEVASHLEVSASSKQGELENSPTPVLSSYSDEIPSLAPSRIRTVEVVK